MMSKKSFLASLKENNRRRIWVWIISGLFWFFFYPVGMALLMSRKKNHNLIDNLTGAAAKARLVEEAGEWLSMNGGVAICVSLLAVICAIQGFSYLYSRKKVDLYHSVPVKKSRRFAVIYLNGVLIYLIPNAVSLLLAVLVAGVNGAMDGNNLRMAFLAFGMNFVLYMGTYGLAVLAVMLTGNLIITLFATAIFLGYEVVLRTFYLLFQSEFYDYFCYDSLVGYSALSSPMGHYLKIMDAQIYGVGNQGGEMLASVGMGILLAVVFAVASYLCYRLRPSEAAGKTMAFTRTKAVIKFLLTVPASLVLVFMVRSIVGEGSNSTAPVIFTMLVAVVLCNCIIEVIYEVDIRAAFRNKYHILISGACVALIYCVFCFDLTGFDAWTPEPDELKDAVVVCGNMNIGSYVDEEFEYIDATEYALAKPGVRDVEAICELSGRKAEADAEDNIWLKMAYRMKNGKIIWREFPVSAEETELLNRIIGSSEYKASAYQLTDENIYKGIKERKIEEITFSTGFTVENLSIKDFDELRNAYIKDLEQVDYSTYREEFACGELSIEVMTESNNLYHRTVWLQADIYPSYKNTMAFLTERGIETKLNLEDIESVTVTNYHAELREQAYEKAMAEGGNEAEISLEMGSLDFEVHKKFTDETQIRELMDAVYPMDLVHTTRWMAPETVSENYYVTIQFKGGAAGSEYTNEAQLITSRIPSWLEGETAYK